MAKAATRTEATPTAWADMNREQRIAAITAGIAENKTANILAEELSTQHGTVRAFAKSHLPGAFGERRRKDQAAKAASAWVAPPAPRVEPEVTAPPDPTPPMVEEAPAPEGGIHLMDLAHRDCRAPLWPNVRVVNMDDYRFCGARATPGSSYCAEHSARFCPGQKAHQRAKRIGGGGIDAMDLSMPRMRRAGR